MRPLSILVTALILGAASLPAQQDAEKAFRDGTAAFAAERFEEARTLFARAAQTDVDNPEVFRWLGRAHYQLGELDAALTAWRRTLELAPDEPLASRMVAALTDRELDADRRLQLAEELLRDGLTTAARAECRSIRQTIALDAGRSARLRLLTAQVELERGDGAMAARELRSLIAADPAQDARPEVQLALGRAEVLLGGEQAARGLARLEQIATGHGEEPAGIRSQLELLRSALTVRDDVEVRDALGAWIGAHRGHARVVDARRLLLEAHLRAGATEAMVVATELWPAIDATERRSRAHQLRVHIEAIHGDAPLAAVAALSELRSLGLDTAAELDVVRRIAHHQVENALAVVDTALRAGSTLQGEPEQALQAARASLAELRELSRDRAAPSRVAFSSRLHALAMRKGTAGAADGDLHPCDRHAIEIALEVVDDAPDQVDARKLVVQVADAATHRGIEGLRTAARVLGQLVAVLDADMAFASWSDVQPRRLQVLDALARAELRDSLERGAGAAPDELTDTQRALVTVAVERIRRDLSAENETVALLTGHASVLVAEHRVELAEEMLASLAQGLPPAAAPAARLAAIGLRADAELGQRERRAAAGLPVPAELSPAIHLALERLYALEATCSPAQLATAHALRSRIVGHFVALEQFEVAGQAIAVRAAAAVDGADAWAELRLARLRDDLAVRELNRATQADGPPEVTPAFRLALDAYLAFLSRRATSDLGTEAVDAVLGIAARFEQAGGHLAAIAVYRELAEALQALTAPAELRRTRSAQAAFAAAAAADAWARRALAECPDPDLDDDTRATVVAALGAYSEFATAHPDSVLLPQVLPRQLDLGVAVARHGAWPEAQWVFAQLIESGVQRVDQVEFCRALCLLGPAFGDHALAMLATATAPPTATRDASRPEGAASGPSTPTPYSFQPAVDALRVAAVAADSSGDQFGLFNKNTLGEETDRLLQTVRQLEQQRAQQIAALRGPVDFSVTPQTGGGLPDDEGLTAAEVERIRAVFDRAYTALLALRQAHPDSRYAAPARQTIRAMIDRWRSLAQWPEAAALAQRFLDDEPRDPDRDTLRLGLARDLATFAARLPTGRFPTHAALRTISERFARARAAFQTLLDDGAVLSRDAVRTARWERAATFLAQARTIARLRASLARGRFVRAARELSIVAAAHPDHAEAAAVPLKLWAIGDELIGLGFHDEAVAVRRELWVRHPTHALADRAALSIAQLYRGPLGQPLRAAELFQELNFARGGGDASLQEAILAVGLELYAARRWVEALHVLESFVDSFPQHGRAGEALTQIGQVHQANGAYPDAIAAYRRVIAEYPTGLHVSAARWSIAECWIHRSGWRTAMDGYAAFQKQYPGDDRVAEATRRVEVLKSLVRYQQVVDEKGQRKAFDAQFQIAVIVRDQLRLPGKAILEFAKVPSRWPESHLADDALFEVGKSRLGLGETVQARVALRRLAQSYPQSPLADDALYLVGRSFEDEADRLVSVTRADSEKEAQEQAQRMAYGRAQDNVRRFRDEGARRVAQLKQEGKLAQAEVVQSSFVANSGAFRFANTQVAAQWASNEAEVLTAAQLADREDRIRTALRRAVTSYDGAARVAGGDKAGEALLRMARIHDTRLEDPDAAMSTWLEIVRQFSGTAVAEDASWRIAQFHDRNDDHRAAIEAFQGFLRNYRRSPNAGAAQAAIAENHEFLGEWVHAMDAYTNYINNFPDGPLVERAREQIAWIKTYRL